jgi:hypothetical protein
VRRRHTPACGGRHRAVYGQDAGQVGVTEELGLSPPSTRR